jgi:uncharacterized protein involved in exopolysaccharide biosynthesis
MVDLITVKPETDFRALLPKLWKGKFIILATLVVTTAAAFGYYYITPRVYSAQAVIMVKAPDKDKLISEQTSGDAQSTLQTDIELLKSYPLAAETVRSLMNGDNQQRPLELFGKKSKNAPLSEKEIRDIALRLLSSVNAEGVRGTNLINVSTSSSSPTEAALLTNSLCKTYQVKDDEWSASQDISLSKTIEQQIVQQRSKVNAIEKQLASFMENREIYEENGNVEAIQDALGKAETEYNNNKAQADILKKQLAFVGSRLSEEELLYSQNLTASINAQLRSIHKNILEKQNDYIALFMKKGADDPETKIALSRLNAAKVEYDKITRQKIAGELASTENTKKYRFDQIATRMQTSIRLAELDNSAQEYLKLRNQYQEQLNQLPQKQITYARLKLDLEVANKTLVFLKEKLDEARIKVASNSGRIAIISPALPPPAQDSPDMKTYLLLGIIGGLLAGMGLVLALDMLGSSKQKA